MKIIPAIDLIEGKCVRLTKGNYTTKKVYNENPLEVAKMFQDAGIRYLHLVDLEGAKANRVVNLKVLESIASKTDLIIDFGGGIKTDVDVKDVFSAGANQINVGSIAFKNSELFIQWLKNYGSENIILSADCRAGKIAVSGWQENSESDIMDYLQFYEGQGVQYTTVTDISKDGMLQGTSIELYQKIVAKTNIKLIASGGVISMDELERLKDIGCYGAIIGKAIYEGKINLKELSKLC